MALGTRLDCLASPFGYKGVLQSFVFVEDFCLEFLVSDLSILFTGKPLTQFFIIVVTVELLRIV